MLVDHFVAQSYATLGRPACAPPPDVHRVFEDYSFPGNVRELQAIIFDVVSRVPGRAVVVDDFRTHPLLARLAAARAVLPCETTGGPMGDLTTRLSQAGALPTLKEATDFLIGEALERAKGSQTVAARMLGVSQSTLSRRLARSRHSIGEPEPMHRASRHA